MQLATAEALLKWVRRATNGNFPRAATGSVGPGDSPGSRKIWKKYAPEALRLLKSAAEYAEDKQNSYDLAKASILRRLLLQYLFCCKGAFSSVFIKLETAVIGYYVQSSQGGARQFCWTRFDAVVHFFCRACVVRFGYLCSRLHQ